MIEEKRNSSRPEAENRNGKAGRSSAADERNRTEYQFAGTINCPHHSYHPEQGVPDRKRHTGTMC